jgi:translation initiation factor IF-3
MIMFRGREQSRPEMGYRLLQRMAADVADLGYIESNPKQDGRNMIMVIGPHKKKAEAKAEQRSKRRPDEVAGEGTGVPAGDVVAPEPQESNEQA